MRVERGKYSKRRDKSHALHVNIRLRKIGKKPTRAEVVVILKEIADSGEVPDGWEMAAIDWRRPTGGSQGWRSGDVSDIQNLYHVIMEMIKKARIGIVRGSE